MQQVYDKVTKDERLDKACEPGVDYGQWVHTCGSVWEQQCVGTWLYM